MLPRWVTGFLLPPASLLVIALAGALLARRRARLGAALAGAAGAGLWILSLPLAAGFLLATLQSAPALTAPSASAAEAIVVLGGDVDAYAPEYGGASLGELSLERVRYAAWLARATGLPVLTTGGVVDAGAPSVGELMALALERELGVAVRWVEPRSSNTWENARFSAEILRAAGVQRVYLVTHAWHMPRSRESFEACGLDVVCAPTAFRARPEWEPSDFVPSSKALRESALALHEWIGRAAYRLFYL